MGFVKIVINVFYLKKKKENEFGKSLVLRVIVKKHLNFAQYILNKN